MVRSRSAKLYHGLTFCSYLTSKWLMTQAEQDLQGTPRDARRARQGRSRRRSSQRRREAVPTDWEDLHPSPWWREIGATLAVRWHPDEVNHSTGVARSKNSASAATSKAAIGHTRNFGSSFPTHRGPPPTTSWGTGFLFYGCPGAQRAQGC